MYATVAVIHNSATLQHVICIRITPPKKIVSTLHMISPVLTYSTLLSTGVVLRAIFSKEACMRPFLAALNGTMVPAYRADSCFIELVYNVW